MEYFRYGDLRTQLQHQPDWNEKIEMIYRIAKNIKTIHDAEMIHR